MQIQSKPLEETTDQSCEVNVRQTFAMSESQYALNLRFSASSIFRKSQKPPRTSVQFFFFFCKIVAVI